METLSSDPKAEVTSVNSGIGKKFPLPLFLSVALNIFLIIILGLGIYFFKFNNLSNDIDLWASKEVKSSNIDGLGWQNLLTSAIINGQILKFDDNKITVKNIQGQIGEINLSKNIEISSQDPQTKKNTKTKGLQDLKLGKDVTIIVKPEKGDYVVTSIGYLITVEKKPEATKSNKLK